MNKKMSVDECGCMCVLSEYENVCDYVCECVCVNTH